MSEREAAIHDLGYQRYAGRRRPQSTRWRVIVRNLLSMSWQGWWRYTAQLAIATLTMVGVAVGIYFSRNEVFDAAPGVKQQVRSIADSLIPRSFQWFGFSALFVNLTILSGAISRDLDAGAFEFYFSRPVRPLDYVLGKVAGGFLLLTPILIIGPLLLTLFRLGLTGDVDRIADSLSWIPRALAVGALATLAYSSIALAFGALTRKARYAIVGYGAFVFMFGNMIAGIAMATNSPSLAALNPASAVRGLAHGVFEIEASFGATPPPLSASIIALVGYSAVAIAIIMGRVRAAQRAGMGGG